MASETVHCLIIRLIHTKEVRRRRRRPRHSPVQAERSKKFLGAHDDEKFGGTGGGFVWRAAGISGGADGGLR